MRNTGVRVYGLVSGLPEKGYEELSQNHDLESSSYENGALTIEFEGPYFFIEDFLDDLIGRLDDDGDGILDYIDNAEWVLIRHQIKKGAYESRKISINDALERYSME